jgi:hypothetical protein
MVASREYVEHILCSLDLAVEANRRTPDRQGSLIALNAETADDVLIAGDLHGHRHNFNQIRRMAALDETPRRHLVLQEVCHGGPEYPQNGGCMSHMLLEDVAALKAKYPERVHFILANHELAELNDHPIRKGNQFLNVRFRRGLERMYGSAADEVQEAYRRFFRTCPLAVRLPWGAFISHSVPENVDVAGFDTSLFARELTDDDFTHLGDVFRLVWGRDYRGANARAFAKLVDAKILINGHEPCPEGFIAANKVQIILDCSDQRAACVILPVAAELNLDAIMERVLRLD